MSLMTLQISSRERLFIHTSTVAVSGEIGVVKSADDSSVLITILRIRYSEKAVYFIKFFFEVSQNFLP